MARRSSVCAVLLTCLGLLLARALACHAAASSKRYPIRPDCISPEIGHCYIANMDFGEEGDRGTGDKSGIQIFEDGQPLGPARSIHQDIREKGRGRYSHWTQHGLYFSASDNSDPRTNGRRYEMASSNPENTVRGLDEFATPVKRHVEVVRGSRHEYRLALGGNLDFENSHTRHNTGFIVAFQPNVSLTIANTGDQPVTWPRLIANGQRDWANYDSLLAEFTRGATNDQEKAYFIWQAAREHRYHCLPLFPDNEFHDPVKMFNSYGLNLCDDMGYCGASLFKHAGLGKPKYAIDPKVRCLNGHMMCEAVVDNRHQFLDIDESVFYLDRENERPVSGDECARDHDLVRREVHYGPVFGGWDQSESSAAIFGKDDRTTELFLRGHEMSHALRPGERVVFRWDNIGKYAAHSQEWDRRPPYFGNSQFIYVPRLAPGRYQEGVKEANDIIPATAKDAALAGGSSTARLVYAVNIPWAICGGTVRAEFIGLSAGDNFAIDVSLDGKKLTRVWEGKGPGPVSATVPIDDALQPRRAPAKYHYQVFVTLASSDEKHGANLKSLEIQSDVMAAPLSLPGLRRGENKFVYSDKQTGPHEVTITHEWRECHALKPPVPPAAPVYPMPGATIRDSIVTFKWPANNAARAYHIQVSRRADFRIPYRPAYDVVITQPEWVVPYTGMFAPDTTFYWRVRSRDRWGVWSEWSAPWTFRWEGPRVPVIRGSFVWADGIRLHWYPNACDKRETQAVAYDVYGSDEKGFSVHKDAHISYTRGQVPPNFLGRTKDMSMLVVSPAPSHTNMNRCYYRVVAVDANGTESICSDFVELPHPHFWSQPPARAKANAVFTYQPGVITSLGDCQHDGKSGKQEFRDIEQLTFALRKAPAWLKLDPRTGALSGAASAPGKVRVELEARTQFGGVAKQEFDVTVE